MDHSLPITDLVHWFCCLLPSDIIYKKYFLFPKSEHLLESPNLKTGSVSRITKRCHFPTMVLNFFFSTDNMEICRRCLSLWVISLISKVSLFPPILFPLFLSPSSLSQLLFLLRVFLFLAQASYSLSIFQLHFGQIEFCGIVWQPNQELCVKAITPVVGRDKAENVKAKMATAF